MWALLKKELQRGKKVYIAEAISLVLFMLFLALGPKLDFLRQGNIANGIIFTWLILNVISITFYEIYDFTSLLLKEQKLEANMTQQFLIKILLFLLFFTTNIFLIVVGNSIGIPLLALALTYLILLGAAKTIENKGLLITLGILWFGTFFVLVYLGYPILVMGICTLIKNVAIGEFIIGTLYLLISMFILVKVLKKIDENVKSK